MNNLYETLGIPPDASDSVIKRAFRKLAQAIHPDKQDGDSGRMADLNRAYMVLSDPVKRKKYDETGDDGIYRPEKSFDQQVKDCLLEMFNSVLMMEGNPVDLAMQKATHKRDGLIASTVEIRTIITRMRKRRERIKTKDGSENVAHILLDKNILNADMQTQQNEAEITVLNAAILKLQNYESDETNPMRPAFTQYTINPFTGTSP